MISRFNRHQGNKTTGATWFDILGSFTRIWDIISVALTHSTASSSPAVLLDQAIQHAKNVSMLHVLCFAFQDIQHLTNTLILPLA